MPQLCLAFKYINIFKYATICFCLGIFPNKWGTLKWKDLRDLQLHFCLCVLVFEARSHSPLWPQTLQSWMTWRDHGYVPPHWAFHFIRRTPINWIKLEFLSVWYKEDIVLALAGSAVMHNPSLKSKFFFRELLTGNLRKYLTGFQNETEHINYCIKYVVTIWAWAWH